MDGILNVNKPAGMTSYGVVAAVKRLAGQRRVGHAGTLDPDATGVLPVCLGKATRIVEFFMDAAKVYVAEIELGACTDTYDAAGTVTSRGDASSVSREDMEAALEGFRGVIEQTPPMYSALKHQGRPLYDLAREGVTVERASRRVTIHRLELLEWHSPRLKIEVECSKGTYIRSLTHDIGQRLGCGAYLKTLERTRYGIFDIEHAVGLEQVKEASERGEWEGLLFPIDAALGGMVRMDVDEAEEVMLKQGKPMTKEPGEEPETSPFRNYRRAYNQAGEFVAILYRDKDAGLWRPKKVFT